MAKKRNYTVRVSYTVYDYSEVEAKSRQDAIEQALEQSSEDSLNDFMQEGEGEGIVTTVNGKSVTPKHKANEMEVLVAYDEEDGSYHNLATMKDSDWTGCKTEAMRQFLMEHYAAWLDCVDDEERERYVEEINEAADRLSVGISSDCCGDNLYWETVTNI